jgi:predicted nucleic acid-binding protein
MSVVSNASPLINLARIGKLDLLRQLYAELFIPEAVWHEVVTEGVGLPGADEVKDAIWIKTQSVTNTPMVSALRQELDAGEAEAVVLTLETQADLLVMDERVGREVARHLGLHCIGLIGVLVEAKHKGVLSAVKPQLDELRNIAGFRIRDALYVRVLQDEEEDQQQPTEMGKIASD